VPAEGRGDVPAKRVDASPKRADASAKRARNGSTRGGRHVTVYDNLKDAILTGTLRPMERITEHEVAARFGLSRTPVREAFRRLQAEGLILVVPQRGSFVSQPNLEDILEIYQIRTPLECLAARIAAETIEETQLAVLEDLVRIERERADRRSAERSLRAAAEFHSVLYECTRNKRLVAFLKEMQNQVHRVRVLWPSTVIRLEETWKEHAALLAALRGRDGAEAERLMREHLQRARASTVDRILPSTTRL
jgi:DNA-binding GntR family transcriptional regulator